MLETTGTEYEVTPQELESLRRENSDLLILDCREPDELELAAMPGTLHIPMAQIPARLEELDPARDTVVVCHHGMRSLQVALWLTGNAGFKAVKSLRGGIDSWAVAIDPSVGRY